MTIQRSHGRPYPLVAPPDELPVGVPAPARRQVTGNRGADGKLLPGSDTTKLASLGGAAKADALKVARLLGRVELPEDHPIAPYHRDAAAWRDDHLRRLADAVGGGEVGPAVLAIVSSAALQHCASRWLFDKAALEQSAKAALDASKLADASRQNLLAAHELCAKEAKARPNKEKPFWLLPEEPNEEAE